MQNEVAEVTKKAKSISIRLIIVLAVFTVILLLFLLITKEFVLEKEGKKLDAEVFEFLKSYTSPGTTSVMNIVTFFGSTYFLLPAYILLALFYLFKKNTRRSLNIAAVGLSSIGLLVFTKKYLQTASS